MIEASALDNWENDRDNGVLWMCQRDLFKREMEVKTLRRVNGFVYHGIADKWNEYRENFSLDNIVGILSWAKYFGQDEILRAVPLFGYWSLRPSNFFYILYLKYRYIGMFFIWIPWIAMVVSCIRKYKRRGDRKFIATDGKLLAAVRFTSCGWKYIEELCTFVLPRFFKDGNSNPWQSIFSYYHVHEAIFYSSSPEALSHTRLSKILGKRLIKMGALSVDDDHIVYRFVKYKRFWDSEIEEMFNWQQGTKT